MHGSKAIAHRELDEFTSCDAPAGRLEDGCKNYSNPAPANQKAARAALSVGCAPFRAGNTRKFSVPPGQNVKNRFRLLAPRASNPFIFNLYAAEPYVQSFKESSDGMSLKRLR